MPEYKIVRTNRRRSVSIKVKHGEVQITVPKHLPLTEIAKIFNARSSWIEKQLQHQADVASMLARSYVSGEYFRYLGKRYPLKLIVAGPENVKLVRGVFLLAVSTSLAGSERTSFVIAQLTRWYKDHAQQRLLARTHYYAGLMSVQPNTIVVKTYKARWGSCSIHGDIAYNWKIIIAPAHIVDYLVVHELSHIKEHNHSARFWRCVEAFIPEYRQSRQWLKANGDSLEI